MPVAAAEGVAELVEVFDFRVQLGKQRRDLLAQRLARRRGGHAAGGAIQQFDFQAFFKLAHGVAECGLRHAELRGGGGKTARVGNAQKYAQIVEVLRHSSLHSSNYFINSCEFYPLILFNQTVYTAHHAINERNEA